MTTTKPLPPHGTTDTAPVRQHIRDLMAAGTGWRTVADLAEVPRSEVHRILYRNPEMVDWDIAEAILAVAAGTSRPVRVPDNKTDATGTRRRIRAMHHDGYDTDRIGNAIGERGQTVRTWLRFARIDVRHAEAVTELFRTWSGVPAEDNNVDPEVAERARSLARRRRWAQAGAWDEDIDDPQASPTRWFGVRRAADLVADADDLLACGESVHAVCWQLGTTLNNLEQARVRVKARALAAERQGLAA